VPVLKSLFGGMQGKLDATAIVYCVASVFIVIAVVHVLELFGINIGATFSTFAMNR
jgi:hypothetical protein